MYLIGDIVVIIVFRRIRDNMTDAKVRTRVKQVDALSFTIGVAFSYVAQFVFLMRPDLFPYLYMLSMAILLPHRYFHTGKP